MVAVDADQVRAVPKRQERDVGKSGHAIDADFDHVKQLWSAGEIEQRQQCEFRDIAVRRAEIGEKREAGFAIGVNFQRREILDRDRAARNGFGIFALDMPIGDDLVRGRLACAYGIEVRSR